MAQKRSFRSNDEKVSQPRQNKPSSFVPSGPDFAVPHDFSGVDPQTLLHMQRTLGNSTVQRYLQLRGGPEPNLFDVAVPDGITTGQFSRQPVQRLFMPDTKEGLDNDHYGDYKTDAPTGPTSTKYGGGEELGGKSNSSGDGQETFEAGYEDDVGGNVKSGGDLATKVDAVTVEHKQSGPEVAGVPGAGAGPGGPSGVRPTLYQGSRGAWVTTLQNKLRAVGYSMTVDGVFGTLTRAAIIRFQEESRLGRDGVVGRRTWEALDAVARGSALSDQDMAELEAPFAAGLAAMDADNYEGALDQFAAIYRDPRLATKPRMLAGTLFNMAGCYHSMMAGATDENARTVFKEKAISLYQEHNLLPGLEDNRVAAASMRIRECRMGQPPTPFADLEGAMHGMNPDGVAVPAGERPTLSAGSRGEWVTTLQNKLRATGYGVTISGVLDEETQATVRRFQEDSRLTPDGVVGRRTWEALDAVARGPALSDADMAELEATFGAGLAAMGANNFEGALAQFSTIYRDPRLATKPRMLAGTLFNMAGCYHSLMAEATDENARTVFKERAISLYQEHNLLPGLEDNRAAAASMRVRECRMGQPPTPFANLEGAMHSLNPGGVAVPAGERPTLSAGSRGEWVTALQNKLRATGYGVTISGVLDEETQATVRRFQEDSRLMSDGVVGRRTWEALDAVARGSALSDADMAELEATFGAGLAAMGANNFEGALAQFSTIYRDPRLATKPRMLAGTLFNLAGCYHSMMAGATDENARTVFKEKAISLYQEHNLLPGLEDNRVAAASMRIRECRLGQPPTSFAALEADMNRMDPSAL